ncbi:Protein CBG01150 [Caenorhabditis briggsae]|uniref:Protein CBG01150 n=1 Tax=Caenorhabditis briggsae TaxID=6238 RepID=A8WPP4_CAEBR|nr:Protein CBG01150 [Caenorhabditis briggsae]CAP22451.1 Protein CBG01150 [Caenorhabditis briggsae]
MIFWYNFLSLLIPLTTSEETFEFFKSRCDSKCTLQPYHIDSESISLFPIDCSSVCAYILIDQNSDLTENQLKNYFRNMRTLYGSVKIKDTNFPSLNFLSRLETIECETPKDLIFIESQSTVSEIGWTNFTSTSCDIYIRADTIRWNLPNLKNFYYLTPTNLLPVFHSSNTNNSFFCITIQEISNLVKSENLTISNIYGPFCNFTDTTFDNERICTIQNFRLQNFDSSCKRIIGNVIIGTGDEEYVEKLKNVTWIYGSVLVEGTQLANIDFLDSLEYVTYFNLPVQLIGIINNPNLANATFPKLKKIQSDNKFLMIFQGNHPVLLKDPNFCKSIKKQLNSTEWHAPSVDGKSCEEIEDAQSSNNQIGVLLVVMITMILLASIHEFGNASAEEISGIFAILFLFPLADTKGRNLELLTSMKREDNLTDVRSLSLMEIWRHDSMRQALKMLIVVLIFNIFDTTSVMVIYTILLHKEAGFTVQTAMNITLIITVITLPTKFFGTFMLDGLGRGPTLFIAGVMQYTKSILLLSTQTTIYFVGSSLLTQGIFGFNCRSVERTSFCYGYQLYSYTFCFGTISTKCKNSHIPGSNGQLHVSKCSNNHLVSNFRLDFPTNFFSILIVQLVFGVYLYRYMPETQGKPVYEIIESMDRDMKSRKATMVDEKTPIIRDRALTFQGSTC